MNVLLIGASGSLINQLIKKMNKEGHRVSLLTGDHFSREAYEPVFERYDFPYDSTSIPEVFESVTPDVTIFLGAFDRRFYWSNAKRESVRFISGLMNLLIGFSTLGRGRFLFLSSEAVFSGSARGVLTEDSPTDPRDYFGMALSQAEELCESFRVSRSLDVVTARLGGYYFQPTKLSEVDQVVGRMCLEALAGGTITARADHTMSLLYESDAVQFIGQLAVAPEHRYSKYNLSSGSEETEVELAETIKRLIENRGKGQLSGAKVTRKAGPRRSVRVQVDRSGGRQRLVLSNERFKEEFGINRISDTWDRLYWIVEYMIRHEEAFLQDKEEKLPWWQRFLNQSGWLIRALLPFVENMIFFIPFFMLNNRATGSQYFAKLDFYLLYVLLFAITFGQQQATFSAMLATAGYLFRQMYNRSGFEVLLDYNTYVWIAQLFILGLVVGYMKDRLEEQKEEAKEDHSYMIGQVDDIREINTTNVHVKDALQTQIINQSDSIGKIYEITSSLEQYNSDEVLFYAAEILGRVMETQDVAIYRVSDGPYARLFTATSDLARKLGNSVKYVELEGLYEDVSQRRVFINRKLDEGLPMMAGAIYEGEAMRLLIMIWKLPWEKMTLGQANLLAVTGALIRDAVLRADRYLEALRSERYVEGTAIMRRDAFSSLVAAYRNAELRGLTEFSLLKAEAGDGRSIRELSQGIAGKLRPNDYIGELDDNDLYVLLTNTDDAGANAVIGRMAQVGILCQLISNDQMLQAMGRDGGEP